MSDGAYLYILRCADGSLYIGTTRTTLEIGVAQHNDGFFEGYTQSRRPVVLIYSEWFDRVTDAIASERKLKKWTRAKKESFIRGDLHLCINCRSVANLILRDARKSAMQLHRLRA